MKTLLWLSRHNPNKSQISFIENKIGEVKIIKYDNCKEEMKKQILSIKPDCIVAIIPRPWISFLLHGVSKSTIWLKPKYKGVHPGESHNEPCANFDPDKDVIINPIEKRYDDYLTKGDNIIHLRHSGYERVIQTRDQLLFINWK